MTETPSPTPRQLGIILLLARGQSVPQVARQLFLTENTVNTYLRRIYRRYQLHSRSELLSLAQENDWWGEPPPNIWLRLT